MKKIKVHTIQLQDCTIFVGAGLIDHIGSFIACDKYSNSVIVTGNNTPTVFIEKVRASIPLKNKVVTLPTGEKHKNIESVQKIWKILHDFGCDRNSLVINLGGGIVTDIGGFSASTYLKGIKFINIPTTLLGQVDAGIGGKTGINFDGAKNLIGLFQAPVGVITDICTLSTLPKREFVSGFGEIIKHGLIIDKGYFQFVTSKKPHEFTQSELMKIVEKSCEIKAKVVTKDVKELGRGKILNFGHTVGHAVEVLTQPSTNPILHGEAVIIGMIVEIQISLLIGLLSQKKSDVIERILKMIDLPKCMGDIPITAMLNTLKTHKKNTEGVVRCTLLKEIGHAVINREVPDKIIIKALQQTKRLFV